MCDAMVALGRRGIEVAALVHRHSSSIRSIDEVFIEGTTNFHVVRVGTFAKLVFTPISPSFPWQMHRLIKSFKPDVLHLHLPNPSVFWALGLPSARRIPWVVHWHSDVISTAQSWRMKFFHGLYRPFESAVLKRAKAIVATSEPYLDSSEPLQPWLEKCHVVPLGVDINRFVDKSKTKSLTIENDGAPDDQAVGKVAKTKQGELNVLAIGRLTYYKGFRYLIEAAAKLENICVDLVGHGDQEKELKELTISLNIQDRVSFHGVLSDAELSQQMQKCDCVCLPSIERTEAFGMVLLEAMYFGKATVVGNVAGSGMGWIVEDGITGIKVKPADADALVEAFRRLSEDRTELEEMGKRGKEKFHQCFAIDHAIEGLIDVYQKVTYVAGAN